MPNHPPCISNLPSLPAYTHHHLIRLRSPSSLTSTPALSSLPISRLPPFSFLPLETSWMRYLILHFRIPIIWLPLHSHQSAIKLKQAETLGPYLVQTHHNLPVAFPFFSPARNTSRKWLLQNHPLLVFLPLALALVTQFLFLFPSRIFCPLPMLITPYVCEP